jgi:hypothetical protein
MAGMLFAFAAAQAALYVLAVLAAPIAVAAVLRHMRWLRALWIKAVSVLALLPVVAGGIFKAGVTLGAFFAGEGLLSILVRLLWLWGATGFLIALAGILGRVTLSASLSALGQLSQNVKAIAATAVMAGSAAAGAGGLGIIGSAVSNLGGPGGREGVGGSSGADSTAIGHYDQAAALTQQAGTWSALGMPAPAQYARNQAHGHELTARKLELKERLARFSVDVAGDDGRESSTAPNKHFSATVNSRIADSFVKPLKEFKPGFSGLSPHFKRAGFDPEVVAERYPEDTARMAAAYLAHPEQIDQADEPLLEAARLAGAEDFRREIFGRDESAW